MAREKEELKIFDIIAGHRPAFQNQYYAPKKSFTDVVCHTFSRQRAPIPSPTALRNDYFKKMDRYLDQALEGPKWLSDPVVAKILMDSLHFVEQDVLNQVMKSHKSYTAVQSNRYLGREGKFWAEERFDRLIRDENDFYRRIYYTSNNPVEAKLVDRWEEWPYTYVHPEIQKEIE